MDLKTPVSSPFVHRPARTYLSSELMLLVRLIVVKHSKLTYLVCELILHSQPPFAGLRILSSTVSLALALLSWSRLALARARLCWVLLPVSSKVSCCVLVL